MLPKTRDALAARLGPVHSGAARGQGRPERTAGVRPDYRVRPEVPESQYSTGPPSRDQSPQVTMGQRLGNTLRDACASLGESEGRKSCHPQGLREKLSGSTGLGGHKCLVAVDRQRPQPRIPNVWRSDQILPSPGDQQVKIHLRGTRSNTIAVRSCPIVVSDAWIRADPSVPRSA